jgi:hypothetical protein
MNLNPKISNFNHLKKILIENDEMKIRLEEEK